MNDRHARVALDAVDDSAGESLAKLLAAPVDAAVSSFDRPRINGVVVGTLVGFIEAGAIPLVTYPQRADAAAVPARATVQLHAAHIGKQTVLMFEDGDPQLPIIVGCLQREDASALPGAPEQVQVEADGRHLVVSAIDRVVLRCGKASITLTKEGKVVIQGAYVSNQSSGVLRLKGGSVQIN